MRERERERKRDEGDGIRARVWVSDGIRCCLGEWGIYRAIVEKLFGFLAGCFDRLERFFVISELFCLALLHGSIISF